MAWAHATGSRGHRPSSTPATAPTSTCSPLRAILSSSQWARTCQWWSKPPPTRSGGCQLAQRALCMVWHVQRDLERLPRAQGSARSSTYLPCNLCPAPLPQPNLVFPQQQPPPQAHRYLMPLPQLFHCLRHLNLRNEPFSRLSTSLTPDPMQRTAFSNPKLHCPSLLYTLSCWHLPHCPHPCPYYGSVSLPACC